MRAARPLPRDPLIKPVAACGLLAALAIGLAAYGKPAGEPFYVTQKPAQTVALAFVDGADGSVSALDATSGRELRRIEVGEGGFTRTTMRHFAMERAEKGVGRTEPFLLSRLPSGRLVLSDPATGRVSLLDAFGSSNSGEFAALLKEEES